MLQGQIFSNGYALIIGVGTYQNPMLSVSVTAQDAIDLRNIFINPTVGAYKESNVTVLTNKEANKKRILSELEEIRKKIANDSNSTLVIFFSGHGWQEGDYYFLPYETDIKVNSEKTGIDFLTALSNEEFLNAVRQIPAKRLLIIFNTCFAGGLGTPLEPGFPNIPEITPVPLGLYDKLISGSGKVIISSSLPNQKSWIKGGATNSLFVTHLISGLKGEAVSPKDKTIKVFDLFNHLSEKVSNDAQSIGVIQTPVLKAYDLTENFPIAILCEGNNLPNGGTETKDLSKSQEASKTAMVSENDLWLSLNECLNVMLDSQVDNIMQLMFSVPEINSIGEKSRTNYLIALRRFKRLPKLKTVIQNLYPDIYTSVIKD